MKAQASSDEYAAAAVKVFIGGLPSSIVIYRFHTEDHLIVGLSFVAGVLLQALIPPRKLALSRMLAAATLFTIAYSTWNPRRWASFYPLVLGLGVIILVECVSRVVRYCRGTYSTSDSVR